MTPRLVSVWFDGDSHQYPRLARVLDFTARRHCPSWEIDVRRIEEPKIHGNLGRFAGDNHRKLEEWVAAVDVAPDGTGVLLLDADTFVCRPLDDLWDLDFDFAYTVRPPGARLPINAGVIAVRAGDRSRRFLHAWLDRDLAFLRRPDGDMKDWRKRYGGQNQASLGATLTVGFNPVPDLAVSALPCETWNCEDLCWSTFSPETRIVHVKSALRMDIFNLGLAPRVKHLSDLWKALESEAAE